MVLAKTYTFDDKNHVLTIVLLQDCTGFTKSVSEK